MVTSVKSFSANIFFRFDATKRWQDGYRPNDFTFRIRISHMSGLTKLNGLILAICHLFAQTDGAARWLQFHTLAKTFTSNQKAFFYIVANKLLL